MIHFCSSQKHTTMPSIWSAAAAARSLQSRPTLRPHRRQPTRLPRPWDSPGKSTGVGCHFPLHCMKVKNESEVAQSCLTLHDPMDCSPPGSSIPGILQARALGWAATALSECMVYIKYFFFLQRVREGNNLISQNVNLVEHSS